MKVYIASGNFKKVINTDLDKKEIVIKMFLDQLFRQAKKKKKKRKKIKKTVKY